MPSTESTTIIILLAVVVVLEVVAILTTLRGRGNATVKVNGVDFKKMAESIESLLRESIPTDGATMSFRVNKTASDIAKLIENSIKRDSSDSEARNAVRTAQDRDTRVSSEMARVSEKLDAIAISLASQARDTGKVLNIVQTNQPQQTSRDAITTTMGAGATAGQLAAGSGIDQTQSGIDTAQKGLDKVKEEHNETT